MEAFALMIPILAVVGAVIIIIYLRRYEHIERMAIIEKGVEASILAWKKPRRFSGALRASLLFIGGGVGLLLGYFLDRSYNMEEVAYFSMLFIFGGIGLGLAYLVEERRYKENRE